MNARVNWVIYPDLGYTIAFLASILYLNYNSSKIKKEYKKL